MGPCEFVTHNRVIYMNVCVACFSVHICVQLHIFMFICIHVYVFPIMHIYVFAL